MSTPERMKILEMIGSGQNTAEEVARLLAIQPTPPADTTARAPHPAPSFTWLSESEARRTPHDMTSRR